MRVIGISLGIYALLLVGLQLGWGIRLPYWAAVLARGRYGTPAHGAGHTPRRLLRLGPADPGRGTGRSGAGG